MMHHMGREMEAKMRKEMRRQMRDAHNPWNFGHHPRSRRDDNWDDF